MDIRSFFKPVGSQPAKEAKEAKPAKPAKRNLLVISDDDDDILMPTEVQESKDMVKETKETKKESVNPRDFFPSRVHQESKSVSKVISRVDFEDDFDDTGMDQALSAMNTVAFASETKLLDETLLPKKSPVKSVKSPVNLRSPVKLPKVAVETIDLTLSEDPIPVKTIDLTLSTDPVKIPTKPESSRPLPASSKTTPLKDVKKPMSKRSLPSSLVGGSMGGVTEKKVKTTPKAEKSDMDVDPVVPKPKAGFAKFMAKQSSGPKAPGSKPLPIGAPDCLDKLSFVFTGDLSSISRDESADLVKRYGGRVVSAVSGKTSYLVVGDEPGESKIAKAKTLKTKLLNEDQFYELIISTAPEANKAPASIGAGLAPMPGSSSLESSMGLQPMPGLEKSMSFADKPSKSAVTTAKMPFKDVANRSVSNELWTDKYKPKTYAEVIGNKSHVEKLAQWLNTWKANPPDAKKKSEFFKAALLSGPPGLGKTTAAHLVAKLEGFEAIEFNASDVRSKNALDKIVKETTQTRSLFSMFAGNNVGSSSKAGGVKGKVIIMDEVDGMSAGDRGGSTELISIIKKSMVPIICICNDRQSPKIRSLANHCLDLKFRRPTGQQVQARIGSIAEKEGLKLGSNVVTELVASTSADIRQILNLLSTYRLGANSLNFDESKALGKQSEKNVTQSPFDLISKLLSQSGFRDYSLMPLFVQENYLRMTSAIAKESGAQGRQFDFEQLKMMREASLAISDGDLLDATARGENSWSLMPVHAVFSTVRPCFFMHGHMSGMYNFPSWLGQNSKQGKGSRVLRELHSHMNLVISGTRPQVRLDYFPLLANKLTLPLVQEGAEGVPNVIQFLDEYYLTKDDFDSLLELGYESLLANVPSNVKAALTRTYNKESHPSPFAQQQGTGKKRAAKETSDHPDMDEVVEDEGALSEEVEEKEDDVEKLFKKKSKATSAKATKATTSKAKGKQRA